jgi:4-hydroxybutyrate CoA-transferase
MDSKTPKSVSAAEAVAVIQSGQRVFVHSVAAAPQQLVAAMTQRHAELRNVEVIHLHTEGAAPYATAEYAQSFRANALFVGENLREAVTAGRADYIPVFLSEIPRLFRKGVLPIDVALIQVSPPDRHGYCSLGVSVDVSLAAVQTARLVLAQVNPHMPRTYGDGLIHVSRLNAIVDSDAPIPERSIKPQGPIELAIGKNCATLIEDGATLQMGIGAIPDAVLASLLNHRRLGIHTEMFSDGVVELVERGIVTGEEKVTDPGRIVAGFVHGTRRLYDFIDENPLVLMRDIGYVNDTAVIRKNPKVVAINSAIEIDLTGQVCADTIGSRQYSGVGGQMDFIRGAALSDGGKPIIALPSCSHKGESRLVPLLKVGAGVTTTRAHVHYVVTEFGIADLYGKNLRQRAKALIEIAHPSHRELLSAAAHERFGL